jgi:hypothetical protein
VQRPALNLRTLPIAFRSPSRRFVAPISLAAFGWHYSPGWHALGLQLHRPCARAFSAASAAIGLTRTLRLQLGWAQYAEYPEISIFRSQFGNANLLPMRSIHATAALEQRLGDRTRLRLNKSWIHARWKFTLYGEIVNLTNHSNYYYENYNSYYPATGQVFMAIPKTFPILPTFGLSVEW